MSASSDILSSESSMFKSLSCYKFLKLGYLLAGTVPFSSIAAMFTQLKRFRLPPISSHLPFLSIIETSISGSGRYILSSSSLSRSASCNERMSPCNTYRPLSTVSSGFTGMNPTPTYDECVRQLYLTNMFHPMKVGLKNIEALHEALGSPMNKPNRIIVHVTGSNGKGSVAVKSAKILELAGHNVGLFVSPHISSFRERMSINGVCISEEQVIELLPYIYRICKERDIPATFFELTTALAFLYFDRFGADAVVLEVGIGGRLDATNCISHPAMCIITSIGLEHTNILGNTIEAIATEKAGIIKKGSPVVVGPNVPFEFVSNIAKEKEAEGCYPTDVKDFTLLYPYRSAQKLLNGIMDYDIENSLIVATAFRLLRSKLQNDPDRRLFPITDQHIEQGTSCRPPCRFEEFYLPISNAIESNTASRTVREKDTVHVVLDIAHNPPAMSYLVGKLNTLYPHKKKRFVVGFSNDKDIPKCVDSIMSAVANDVKRIHLIQASTPRAATFEEIWQAVPILKNAMWNETDRSVSYQVKAAIDQTMLDGDDEILVICGSVFLMSEAREAMGIEEPRDSKLVAEVAGSGYRSFQDNVKIIN